MATGSRHCFLTCLGLIISLLPIAGPFADEPVKLDDRMRIFNALNEQNLIDKDRQLVRLAHLCNLVINDEYYPVVAIKEHMKGAQVPRRIGLVFVLDSSLKLVKEIPFYPPNNPLYCKDNQLFWDGEAAIDTVLAKGEVVTYADGGNVMTFTEAGKKVVASYMQANDFSAQTPPQ